MQRFVINYIVCEVIIIEVFKQIEDFPDYQIGNYGTIKSFKKGQERILKPWLDSQGRYYMITLCKNGEYVKKTIHRLVCTYFVDNPDNKNVVNHKDHNTHNNTYTNLEWVTTRENIHHSYSTMSPARNKRRCRLVFPSGKEIEFESYADVRRYRNKYNLDFAEYGLNYYGKSNGFQLIKL